MEGVVKLKINTTTIIPCKHIIWRELGIFCEPLCSTNFHGILYIYMQWIMPCSTETNTELLNHLLNICKTTFNTIWAVPMEPDAIWRLFSTWSVTTHHARVCGGSGRSGSDSRWLPDCQIWHWWPRSKQQSQKDMSTLFSRNAACGTWNWIVPEWNSTSESWNSWVSYPPLRAWEDPGHIADAWT